MTTPPDQVLKDLPKKTQRIEWCALSASQKTTYNDTLKRSRKVILEQAKFTENSATAWGTTYGSTSDAITGVLANLCKAATHPLLFRRLFSDETLKSIARTLLEEPDLRERGCMFEYVYDDLQWLTDLEMQTLLKRYKATQHFLQDDKCYYDSGKISALLQLLNEYSAEGRRVLVLSWSESVLDMLKVVFKLRSVKYLLITRTTPVDVRQSLVDEFTQDESIPVFLLSTRAGGMDMDLTAASAVIHFDQHPESRKDPRAYSCVFRIGQTRDFEVVKLISRGTVEEDAHWLRQTEPALTEAVAGDAAAQAVGKGDGGEAAAEAVRTSLMSALRKQLEDVEDDVAVSEDGDGDGNVAMSADDAVEVADGDWVIIPDAQGPTTEQNLRTDGEAVANRTHDGEDVLTLSSDGFDMEMVENLQIA